MKRPWIQVSIDTQDIPTGLRQVEVALAIEAEWIEVGTPLLTFAGIDAIRAVKEAVSDRLVLADFKALDGVAQYFKRAGELGASVATVMAVANEASIQTAIETGHESGVEVQVDLLGVERSRLARRVKEIQALGADYLLLHLAIDELMRNPEADPLEGLDEVLGVAEIPVGPVVFSSDQGTQAISRGASYVVIGYPLITSPDAQGELARFASCVRGAHSTRTTW